MEQLNPPICCLQEICFTVKDKLKVQGQKRWDMEKETQSEQWQLYF